MSHFLQQTASSSRHLSGPQGQHSRASVEAVQLSLQYAHSEASAASAHNSANFVASLRDASSGHSHSHNESQKPSFPKRASELDRKIKASQLSSRLLARPERWDLHKAGILLSESSNPSAASPTTTTTSMFAVTSSPSASRSSPTGSSGSPANDTEMLKSFTTGLRGGTERGGFNTRMTPVGGDRHIGAASHAAAWEAEKSASATAPATTETQHVKRRLSNHLQTRPSITSLLGKNIVIPDYYNDKSKTEFFVVSSDELDITNYGFNQVDKADPTKMKFLARQAALKSQFKPR